MKKIIYLAAGGTGGHINAALSLGEVFKEDYQVKFLTGTRHLDYKLFKDKDVLHLKSRPLRSKNPLKILGSVIYNLYVFINIYFMFLKNSPAFVIGLGGYVCGPTLLAAKLQFRPIFILEQNSVVGLTNKILSKISNLVFTNFKNTKGLKASKKVIHVGNPIRSSISYHENKIENDTYKILVFGGSLGAMQVNQAIQILSKRVQPYKLDIIHQVGKGNIKEVENIDSNITYQQYEYLDNMDEMYKNSNIIISRAGASTISEVQVVRKPTIFIPYPAAVDNHQYYNAIELQNESDFYISVLDHKLTGDDLANMINEQIKKIIGENLLVSTPKEHVEVAKLIKEKIENYVWNK